MSTAGERKLSARATALLEASDAERIEHIKKNVFIPYDKAKEILEEIEQMLTHPVSRRPPNILIVGRSRNGKTELLNEFKSRHPAQELRYGDAIYAPVIYLQSPPGPDEKVFLRAALQLLGVEPRRAEDPGVMLGQFIDQLKKVKTKILLLDEVNSMLAGSVTKQLFVMNMLKYISNETSISIAAAGTIDALNILHSDEQLGSRFPARPLPLWDESSKEFLQLLASFEYVLPLRRASGLHRAQLKRLIYGISEGRIGGVAKTIQDSAIVAIENGEEAITEEILQAYAEQIRRREEDIKRV